MKDYVLDALHDLKQQQIKQDAEIKKLKSTAKYHQGLISVGATLLGVFWVAIVILAMVIE
ncbi:TPA: hypothetical protein ACX6RM_001299 [Photobacterium damselae]